MYIVMIASECAPAIKAGGLGDVVSGLSHELALRGNAIEVILPKYDNMRYDHVWDLHITYEDLWVPWYNHQIRCTVWFGFVHGRKCFFIEPHSHEGFFNRGTFYGCPDDTVRFSFFTKAALEFMLKTNKRPDIIHTHDWQTALTPVLLFELYKHYGMDKQRVVHTIHNFKHQGIATDQILWLTGLGRPEYYMHQDRLLDDFNSKVINFTKGGIVYANAITTVSPQHAWEVQNTDQGYGLGHALHVHNVKFQGVLNGLDYDMWNPSKDIYIPAQYDVDSLEDKYNNKKALRDRLLIEDNFRPIIAFIGRLDQQKGVHLIRHALFYALEHGAQFVLLGSGTEKAINDDFLGLKAQLNDNPNCHLEIGYNEELAHLIYAGADMMIVPSLFEPCGLVQLISLRYGTVPIVHTVGGLADTVFDYQHSDKPLNKRNGFIFNQPHYTNMEDAMYRAIHLWFDQASEFRKLIENGMRYDYSWNHSGQQYIDIYERIRHK